MIYDKYITSNDMKIYNDNEAISLLSAHLLTRQTFLMSSVPRNSNIISIVSCVTCQLCHLIHTYNNKGILIHNTKRKMIRMLDWKALAQKKLLWMESEWKIIRRMLRLRNRIFRRYILRLKKEFPTNPIQRSPAIFELIKLPNR